MTTEIFVVWDFTIEGLKITLESLQESPPKGHLVRVPGLSYQAGTILFDVVLKGIHQADRVLVVTDKPNANVGFEAGLALGLGKPILFAHFGRKLPKWSSQPPLRNYLQSNFTDINELEALLLCDDAWIPGGKASKLQDDGPCLDLCPERGEGSALRRKCSALGIDGWRRPPDRPFLLTEFDEQFGDTARLVWTIANFGEGTDERDGAENAANAIIAGWFFTRCLGPDASLRNDRFWVIRSVSSREVVDVHLYEKEFKSLAAYADHIQNIERVWKARLEPKRKLPFLMKPDSGVPSDLRIAVTAFKDIGRLEGDEGYGFGFTEWVISDLATVTDRHSGIVTIPRQDVVAVENRNLSIAQIGKELKAHYILEGCFDRSKDPCQFTARLIDVAEDRYMSPERFSEKWTLHDLASRRIAEYVLNSLLPKLEPDDRQALEERPTHDHAAVMALWNGQSNRRQFNNLRQEDYFYNAEGYFKKALELDPQYVDALSELGFLYILKWETDSQSEWLEKSRQIWKRIREVERDNSFALAELGYLSYVHRNNTVDALQLARLAVDVNPEHPIAHNVLALLYLYLGFYEANILIEHEEVFHRAMGYIYPYTNSALALQLMGKYDDALKLAEEARRIESHAMVAILLEGAQHFYKGEMDLAKGVWQEGLEVCPPTVTPILEVTLAWIRAREGDRASARQVLEDHGKDAWLSGPYGPYYISLCALAGEEDLAVGLLEKEVTFASSYRYLISESTLRSLANHPRFIDLLEKHYEAWIRNLELLTSRIQEPPAPLPTPREFVNQQNR